MTRIAPPPPEQGQLVDVRKRQYIVTSVMQNTLPDKPLNPIQQGAQHLVSLSSVEDDALGEELHIIWELEPGAHIHENVTLPDPTGFDDPVRLDAFLDAVRWGAVSNANVQAIQAPFRSGIDIEDYQLDPVVRGIQMPRVNLLIADDVGLGKTIEAGLVILELLIRHRARRVLIVCPASLQIQWRDQMRNKFGLDFRIVDSQLMKQLRRHRGLHVNPWTHFPRLITSIDFLKRERPMRRFREVLPQPGEPIYPRRFDILVLDEAHNAAPSGGGKYAIDSDRTEAIRQLVPHFEHKLFLTATPHNGYRESFTALLELLDSQRFARGVDPNSPQFRRQLQAVMVRRLKSDLPLKWDGSPRFPTRCLEAIEVEYAPEERRIHEVLKDYTTLRQTEFGTQAEKFATDFVLKLLKKRLLSCPEAFGMTLAQHAWSLHHAQGRKASVVKPSLGILRQQLDKVEEDYAIDDEMDETTHDALDAATRLFRTPTPKEQALLAEMKAWAESASARPDSKAVELLRWMHSTLKPTSKWNTERVILFTEYRATQNWLHDILAREGFVEGGRLLTLYGGMDTQERERIKAAFQADPSVSPVRVLLATDAASEGIDLQNHCAHLIHYEIPWNPNRMEQRNGRIDRHGQKARDVHIYHFVGKGYNERQTGRDVPVGDLEADLEFLMRAALKVETIREDLGNVGPVIAQQVEEAMLGRRTRLDTQQEERAAEPTRHMLKFTHQLQAHIAQLMTQLRDTERELRLSPDNIQSVVDIALDLAGHPPLIPAEVAGIWPDPAGKRHRCPVFHLPVLPGTWAHCAEGLAHPHTGEIRPIVFDHHLAHGRDDVVLAHLNHRLVQMSLRLLRAEVWSRDGAKQLHRLTARLVPDHVLPAPAMIVHARLVFVSRDGYRLHEEVMTAGGQIQGGRLTPLGANQVQDALSAASIHEPSEPVKQRLLELWPLHRDLLLQALGLQAEKRSAACRKALATRVEKEVADITTILKELENAIQVEVEQHHQPQLDLFNATEQEQFRRNLDSLGARLRRIPEEIDQETQVIRARFAHPQVRLFPIAVTYVVPEKLARG